MKNNLEPIEGKVIIIIGNKIFEYDNLSYFNEIVNFNINEELTSFNVVFGAKIKKEEIKNAKKDN